MDRSRKCMDMLMDDFEISGIRGRRTEHDGDVNDEEDEVHEVSLALEN
jgi:hypothetical protein